MSNGAVAGAAGAAAAIAQAIKASGVIVKVEPAEFERILSRQQGLLVVTATRGLFSTRYQYLTSYKGLAFFSESTAPLSLPGGVESVAAQQIWIPG
jgi:ethanolamine utilization protein EutA (predicted chaperonin)